MIRRLLRARPIQALIVIAVLALVWQSYLSIRGPGIVTPELAAEVAQAQPLTVTVTLGFPPEQFHTLFLQSYGHVVGTEADTVTLRDVRPESVGMLERVYWIQGLAVGDEDRR